MRIRTPVPELAQMAWLSCNSKGCPLDVILVAAVVHWAVTQGPLAPGGGGNVQPAMVYGLDKTTVGCPETRTRVLTAVGWATPACMHWT